DVCSSDLVIVTGAAVGTRRSKLWITRLFYLAEVSRDEMTAIAVMQCNTPSPCVHEEERRPGLRCHGPGRDCRNEKAGRSPLFVRKRARRLSRPRRPRLPARPSSTGGCGPACRLPAP